MPKVLKSLPEDEGLTLTAVSFMCNSNLGMKDAERYFNFKRDMRYLVRERIMNDLDAANYIFGEAPFVHEVRGLSYATEKGPKFKRGHFNLSVEIWHTVKNYSLPKLRLRMKHFLDDNYSIAKSWNVYVTLHDARNVNYSNKEERIEVYDAQDDDHPELQRLGDGEIVEELNNMGKLMRKLKL